MQPAIATTLRGRISHLALNDIGRVRVRLADDLPSTATNKILKRELVALGADPAGREVWKRDGTEYAPRAEN